MPFMSIVCFILSSFIFLQDVPYKPEEEFTIKLDLSVKQRPPASQYSYNFDETPREYQKRNRSGPTPYVILFISIDEVSRGEAKFKIFQKDEKMVLSKKINKGMEFKLDVGYTDDLKDQMEGHYHLISFYDSKKNEVSRIEILFDKDGNYSVNGKIKGKI